MESVGDFIHKEKKQKKNNKTIGQVDNLIRVAQQVKSDKHEIQPDKLLQREAKYMKNNHIDRLIERLMESHLITEKYKNFYAGCAHELGVSKVTEIMIKSLDQGHNPPALFHFLINKELNSKRDQYSPRF